MISIIYSGQIMVVRCCVKPTPSRTRHDKLALFGSIAPLYGNLVVRRIVHVHSTQQFKQVRVHGYFLFISDDINYTIFCCE